MDPRGPEPGEAMSRYDWPSGTRSGDDAVGRAVHNDRFRPAPNVSAPPGGLPPEAAPEPAGGAHPHNAPVGNRNLWFSIGPSVTVGGQASGQPNVAGRIRDLQVEPTTGARVYA